MDYLELKNYWMEEEKKSFKGWDFTYIHDRTEADLLHWDYSSVIKRYMKNNYKLLDMGTGGGEFLLTLNHPYRLTAVTEGFSPNYKLCREKLLPLGIDVKFIEDDSKLPFEDEKFDIIINRHESYDIHEVYRILKAGGIFITQQVGGENDKELIKILAEENYNSFADHTLENNINKVKKKAFKIIFQAEDFTKSRFFDAGAIVYFAKIINFEFPEFSVEKCINELYDIHEICLKKGFFECTQHRFLIAVQK
jgi:SAM-dependent methyltransferase